MLSTNYKMGEKKNKAALYSLHFSEGFDFKQFHFRVKGVQPATQESEFAAGFCQNAFCDGSAASLCISGPAASERSGLQREYGVALCRLWPSRVPVPRGKTSVALKASVPWRQVVLCSPCEGRTKT